MRGERGKVSEESTKGNTGLGRRRRNGREGKRRRRGGGKMEREERGGKRSAVVALHTVVYTELKDLVVEIAG